MTHTAKRGKRNDLINHPNKTKPSKINKDLFDKQRRTYWEN